MIVRETPREIIMGLGPEESLLIEARPALGAKALIAATQIVRPNFGYHSRRITPLEGSTLITFEGFQGNGDQVERYAEDLTIPVLGRLVSRQVPEMEGETSLFRQRDEIVASAQEALPSLEPLVASFLGALESEAREAADGDISAFDRIIRKEISKIADPYDEEGAAFVWKTVGSGNVANAQIFEEEGTIHIMFGYHGQEDTDAVRTLSGLVMPDSSLHSFAGPDGLVLRDRESILVIKTGRDKSVLDNGFRIPERSLLDRVFHSLVQE